MSHAAPSCAGFAPRHSTFGVTTQKFGMGEPRSLAHPLGAAGIDEDGKPPIRNANKKELAHFKDDVPYRRERSMEGDARRLLEDEFLHHLLADDFANIGALDHEPRSLLFIADELGLNGLELLRQSVEGGPVLVFVHEQYIPVRVVGRGTAKQLV